MTGTYLKQFNALGVADEPEWLGPVRRGAMDRFAQTGFPAARDEEWRFTPVTAISQAEFSPAAPSSRIPRDAISPFAFGHSEWPLLVFVDGRFDAALSSVPALPGGARAMSLAEAIAAGDETVARHLGHHAPVEASGFTALNTAFISDGAFLHVPAGVELTSPVHVLFVSSGETEGTVAHPRNLIVIERKLRDRADVERTERRSGQALGDLGRVDADQQDAKGLRRHRPVLRGCPGAAVAVSARSTP